MNRRGLSQPKDLILIFTFVAILFLPLVDSIFSIDPSPALSENRRLFDFPEYDLGLQEVLQHPFEIHAWYKVGQQISLFPLLFTDYFDDHFGFRRLLVRGSSLMTLAGFPSASDVIVGKDEWLYLGGEKEVSSYLRYDPMNDDELLAWLQELNYRQEALSKSGITYVLVLAPEKSTIYPEFMPERMIPTSSEKRLDQLTSFIERNSNLLLIDARNALSKATDISTYLYYRTDSHWNDVGAFLVAKEIVEQLSESYPSLTPPSLSSFDLVVREKSGGDLAGLLALSDVLQEESVYIVARNPDMVKPAATGIAQELIAPDALQQPSATEIGDDALPRAVLFIDSFGNALLPYLSSSFSRLLALRQYSVDWAVVEKERPDIVIQVIVERQLYAPRPPESTSLLR